MDRAKEIYDSYRRHAQQIEFISLNGIALAEHLKSNDKAALVVSQTAFDSLTEQTEGSLKNQTTERYIQALIWNKKYSLAAKEIDVLMMKKQRSRKLDFSVKSYIEHLQKRF